MKKALITIIALAMVSSVMAFTLAGCGGEKKEETSSSSSASEKVETSDSEDNDAKAEQDDEDTDEEVDEEKSDGENAEDSNNDESTSSNATVVGQWTLSQIVTADGKSQTLEEYCADQGVDASGLSYTYTFSEDGSVSAEIGGIGVKGTFTFDGKTITTTFESGTFPFEFDEESDTIVSADENTGMKSIMTRL